MSEEKYFLSGEAVTKEELRNILSISPNWLASESRDSFVSTWTRIDLWPNCVKVAVEYCNRYHEFLVSYDMIRVEGKFLCFHLFSGMEVRVNL